MLDFVLCGLLLPGQFKTEHSAPQRPEPACYNAAMLYDDTIAAIATPPGVGGIGIIRISGAGALPVLKRVFRPANARQWRPYRMRYGHVVASDGTVLDEALAVLMRGPHSFTAEDVAEISCHGGPLVLETILQLVLRQGVRAAEPGEFTMRAFANGRIDLSRAEATLDVINARTATGLAQAQAHLQGWLAGQLASVRALLLEPLAYATALVDFPEDDIDVQEVLPPLQRAERQLTALVEGADRGVIYRQGARAVLVGAPNVGKSSLMNALLRIERAIVTPIPGTTRDTLEETANLGGIPVVLTDTAGITETADVVEQIGVERSRGAVARADLALLVLDATRPITDDERAIAALAADKPLLAVLNKTDLLDAAPAPAALLAQIAPDVPLRPAQIVATSARTGAGIDTLASEVAALLLGQPPGDDSRLVTNPRHRDALGRALAACREALAGCEGGMSPDLLAVDLTAAISALGEITGESLGDDLLAAIFSRFCIGK